MKHRQSARFHSFVPLQIMDSSSGIPATTDDVIEAIVHSLCGERPSAQAMHILRESLRNLVRLAKAEHIQEMQVHPNHAARRDKEHFLH